MLKRKTIINIITHVRLSKRAFNSSRRNCTSSRMSSSVHFRPQRLFAKGNSCATSIDGRFWDGAFVTRFWNLSTLWVVSRNDELTRNVATITRMTFSFIAFWATSVRSGMISYFLYRRDENMSSGLVCWIPTCRCFRKCPGRTSRAKSRTLFGSSSVRQIYSWGYHEG